MKKDKIKEFVDRWMAHQMKLSERFKIKLSEQILKLDLGIAHFMVLKVLSFKKDPPIITDLAKGISIAKPMMTHTIDKLESTRMVKRVRDGSDRRIIRIELTTKGKNLIKICDDYQRKMTIEFINKLSSKEQEELIYAMNILMNVTEKADL